MFDSLGKSLQQAFSKVQRSLNDTDDLSKANMKEPLKEIRRALLEADVALPVVKTFLEDVEKRSQGTVVVSGVTPAQQLAKVVQDALTDALGGAGGSPLALSQGTPSAPAVILMAGLQGVGKTTTVGKLAKLLAKDGRKLLLASADTFRPAAAEQLEILAGQVKVPFMPQSAAGSARPSPVAIARKAVDEAKRLGCDTVIIDTAGRLQIDEDMMLELRDVKAAVKPAEVLLVMDAMTGQEAAGVATAFTAQLGVTGAVLTKLDGDTRGGAALSVRGVANVPIKLIGVGEGMDALEPFFPDRAASRILGMGDVVSLVEKAAKMNQSDIEALGSRILKSEFDFNDFLKQSELMAGLGSMGNIAKMIPGMQGQISDAQVRDAERRMRVFKSIIQSMTKEERGNPELILTVESRAMRAAKGAGRTRDDVAMLAMTYTQMKSQYANLAKMAMGGGGFPGMGGAMGGLGNLMGGMGGMGGASGLAAALAGGGGVGAAAGAMQAAAMQAGDGRPKSKEEQWREQQKLEKERAKAGAGKGGFGAGAAPAAAKKGFGGGGAAAAPVAAASKGFGKPAGAAAAAAPPAKKGGAAGGKKKK